MPRDGFPALSDSLIEGHLKDMSQGIVWKTSNGCEYRYSIFETLRRKISLDPATQAAAQDLVHAGEERGGVCVPSLRPMSPSPDLSTTAPYEGGLRYCCT